VPICHAIGYKEGLLYSLAELASVNVAHQEYILRAAQLAGVAETLRAGMGAVLRPFEHGVYERAIATVKATLGEEAFHAAFESGQKLTLEEAVQLALEDASR